MCGIAGYLQSANFAEGSVEILSGMTNSLSHRGPDSSGEWLDDSAGIALGHRRLSVIDIGPTGAQPMTSPSGRYVIVFNGEIYNHLALRSEIKGVAVSEHWRGGSDTETLLACFDVWGISKTIERTVGMFAFAIWDRAHKTLTLGRDRLGEKPLYYGWQGSGNNLVFLFGSEIKALKAHPAFKGRVDRGALALYMRFNNVPAPYSIYEGIYKLMPGSLLTISLANPEPQVSSYWSGITAAIHGVSNRFNGSAPEAIDALEGLLKNVISQEAVADVPLGAFLSGGVDSSTIVALMQSQSMQRVKTFSIGFGEDDYNEAVYAKAVAKHLGTDHQELYVSSQQAMSVIPSLSSLYDEPFADSSQIPTYLVSKMARQQVTVALSGDGGDELFAGYNRHQITAGTWSWLHRWPKQARTVLAAGILKIPPAAWDQIASNTSFSNRWAGLGYKLHKGASVLGASSVSELYLGLVSQWSDPQDVVLGATEPSTLLFGNRPSLTGLDDVEQMMALDMLTYLSDDILTKVDRAAMAVGLETRVPFLDHRLVEFAWSLPMGLKLQKEGGSYTTKWALREVLYRYVPKELIERPKMGFGIPLGHWLRGPLRDWAESLLDERRLMCEGYFDPNPIRKRWEEHLSGKRNWEQSLWCVLMFQAWLSEQNI